MNFRFARTTFGMLAATATLPLLASCGGGAAMNAPPVAATNAMPTNVPVMPASATAARTTDSTAFAAIDRAQDDEDRDDRSPAILPRFDAPATIGSTVDPINGDQNPYGLDIAPVDAGKVHRGDLVVCNFNNAANVQGTGTTIVALRPQAHAVPIRIAQNSALLGCNAVAVGPTGFIWAAAFAANDNPIVAPTGTVATTLPGGPWHGPFGQAFSPTHGPFGDGAFYESNATDGSIVRVNLTAHGFTFDVIAAGFAVNGGAPGSILGPSGLQYDRTRDALYVIDGADNSVTLLRHVSFIPAGGVVVHGGTFSGPSRNVARRIFAGAPLNGPISAALLPGGHLAIGNTLDPAGTNLIVELARNGRVVATKNVDTGAGAAIFGMVASGRDADDTKLYFNDDNDNTVKVLTR